MVVQKFNCRFKVLKNNNDIKYKRDAKYFCSFYNCFSLSWPQSIIVLYLVFSYSILFIYLFYLFSYFCAVFLSFLFLTPVSLLSSLFFLKKGEGVKCKIPMSQFIFTAWPVALPFLPQSHRRCFEICFSWSLFLNQLIPRVKLTWGESRKGKISVKTDILTRLKRRNNSCFWTLEDWDLIFRHDVWCI